LAENGALDARVKLAMTLRSLRRSRGWSQRELAVRLLLGSHSSIVSFEQGRRLPHADIIAAYERVFGITDQHLLGLRSEALLALADSGKPLSGGPAPHGAEPGPGVRTLPGSIADFTGRAALRAALAERLTGGAGHATPGWRVVALVGPAGVGKTTLAIHAAHQLARQFPDGCLYASLVEPDGTPVSASFVLRRFLAALGVPHQAIPEDLTDCVERYRDKTSERRMLIVLDNAGTARQIRPLLPSGAHSAVLITSRVTPVGVDGLEVLPVQGFPPGESLEFLGRVIGQDRLRRESPAAHRITDACGHLPLALRIVAARLVERRHWTLATMAQRLASERRRLDELRVGDLAIRSSIWASYRHLGAAAQRALRLLATLDTADLTTWLAAAALGVTGEAAENLLEELTTVRLLEPTAAGPCGSARYQFHDLVRLYGREQAAQDTEEERREALLAAVNAAAHWAHRADRSLPGGVRGLFADPPGISGLAAETDPLGWLAREEGNLVALVIQACNAGQASAACALGGRLGAFFELRSRYDQWQRMASAIGAAGARSGAETPRAWAAYFNGVIASELGQPPAAICFLEQARALFAGLKNDRARAYAGIFIANNQHGLGRLPEAAATAAEAGVIFGRLDDEQGQGYACLVRGYVMLASGDPEQGVELLNEALRCYRAANHRQGIALAQRALGRTDIQRGNAAAAIDRYRAALSEFAGSSLEADRALLTLELAEAFRLLAELDEAERHAAAAERTFRDLGNRYMQARAEHIRARIAISRWDGDRAVGLLREVYRTYARVNAHLWQIRACRDLGNAWLLCGNHTAASAAWKQGLRLVGDAAIPEAGELRELISCPRRP
jgi:tetratricopeptide (TPR) repeat protein